MNCSVFVKSICAACFFLCFGLCLHSEAPPPRSIKIGYYQNDGFSGYDEAGNLSGYAFDYLTGLQRYLERDFAFIENISFAESLDMLARGELDIVAGIKKTPERERLYAFSDWALGSAYTALSVRSDDSRWRYGDYAMFAGMKVGVVSGSSCREQFSELCREQGTDEPEYVSYETYGELRRALHETKEIDAVLGTTFRSLAGEKIVLHCSFDPYYIAVNRQNTDLLRELNAAQRQLQVYNAHFISNLEQTYETSGSFDDIVLTAEEAEFIRRNPVVQVAAMNQWYPIFYLEHGRPAGILVDVYERLEQVLGITFDIHVCRTISDAQAMLNRGDCAVYMGTFGSDNWALEKGMRLSSGIITTNLSYITACSASDIYQGGYVCAVERDSYISNIAAQYTDRLLFCDTIEACVEAVHSGAADAAVIEAVCAMYLSQEPRYRNLRFHSLQEDPLSLRIGVAFDSNETLYSVLNKGILSLPHSFIAQCVYKYQMRAPDYTITDALYLHPVESLVIAIVCVCTVILIVFLFLVLRLRNRHAALLEEKNRELTETAARAEQAAAAKNEFLASMSHDIRTPLNIVLGMEQIALAHAGDAAVVSASLAKSQKSAKYLLSLLNDILEKTKLDSQKLTLHYSTVFLSEPLNELCENCMHLAVENNIRFSYDIAALSGVLCRTDAEHTVQALRNVLISMFRTAEPDSGVVFAVSSRESEHTGSPPCFLFTVSVSSCAGELAIQQLFDPFPQFASARNQTGAPSSAGIGLSIAKQLLAAMQGTLAVTGGAGGSCVCTVSLPLEVVSVRARTDEREAEDVLPDYTGNRALIVEDNELNQEILREILETLGISCETASNGREGLDRFSAAPVGTFNIIFMDIRMPVMDGYESAAAIRALDRQDAQDIPIVAVSANSFADDREKSLAAGINRHLEKPIQLHELMDALHEFVQKP